MQAPHKASPALGLLDGVMPVRDSAGALRAPGVESSVQGFSSSDDKRLAEGRFHIGRPELADNPRFAASAGRVANREALAEQLGAAFAGQDGQAARDALLRPGGPGQCVRAVDQAAGASRPTPVP